MVRDRRGHVPVSVPHQKFCTAIDTLLTFVSPVLCAVGLVNAIRCDAVTENTFPKKKPTFGTRMNTIKL